MFFDRYPRFYDTSETSPYRGRLNLRFEAIFGENRDIFEGAKVLDIASHDGRWSMAALECGAKSVIGIEARPDLVKNAEENLAHYGYGPDRCSFVTGDIFEVFANHDFDVDVVLCLGFLYHTLRYNELLHGIRKANPHHVIIDTVAESMMQGAPKVDLHRDRVTREGSAVADQYSHGDAILVGGPNLKAIRMMMTAHGFKVERRSDWGGLLRDNPRLGGVGDYAKQRRITVRCVDERALAANQS